MTQQVPTQSFTLSQLQRLFMRLVPKLINWAYDNGYELTLGDGYRDPRVFGEVGVVKGYGHKSSCHKSRLAIDLNLFKNGVFLQLSSDHAPLGAYWKSLHPLCRWGGDFSTPDGNHYSMEWQGQQ